MRSQIVIPILFSFCIFSCQGEQATRKPNIIIIFLDDLMDEYPEVTRKMLDYAMMHDSLFCRF